MAHITAALGEKAVTRIFNSLRDDFLLEKAATKDFGAFSAGYSIRAKLKGGSVDLRQDNTILLKELDVKWEKLDLTLGLDIPKICVGGFCIIPNPFGGCLVRAPSICVFENDPDISITLPLGGFTSEVSLSGSLEARHVRNPARPASMNDWDAAEATPPVPDLWKIHYVPQWVDLDIIDVADTVGDLLEKLVNAAIDGLLSFLPKWARDIVKAVLGPVIGLIRTILDIPDDIQEWISDLLNVSFGIVDFAAQYALDWFAKENPLFSFEDPYTVLEGGGGLVPVKIPVTGLNIRVDDKELLLTASVG